MLLCQSAQVMLTGGDTSRRHMVSVLHIRLHTFLILLVDNDVPFLYKHIKFKNKYFSQPFFDVTKKVKFYSYNPEEDLVEFIYDEKKKKKKSSKESLDKESLSPENLNNYSTKSIKAKLPGDTFPSKKESI